ncbi:MAG TPA: DUF4149 domain-containing protein [Nitrospirota bacterium]|nr:DUF4149 domain-containing protein [Nitrospirota bacterium]
MKSFWFSAYTFILALWVGGMALFTFMVTPLIFRSYTRDIAGDIVGKLFPGYFPYNLALSALALILLYVASGNHAQTSYRASLILVVLALIVNIFITVKLYPEAVRVKQKITSFEREPADSIVRREFACLHALSASLNILLLGDGIALLLVSPFITRR